MTFTEYTERLEKARKTLLEMVEAARTDDEHGTYFSPSEEIRLAGKAEGVALALSYAREYERSLLND